MIFTYKARQAKIAQEYSVNIPLEYLNIIYE